MRCDNCIYWGVGNDECDALYGTKRCGKALQMWNAGNWSDAKGEDVYTLLPEHAGQMMFTKDGSDYMADLYTRPEFFCAHFTQKDPT